MPRYAAIDIGSNSIRMEAAEVLPGQPARILASDREVTRLGESVFRGGAVSEEAVQSACAVLERMSALYRRLEVVGARAVATSAIRDTRNQKEFLRRASQAAGTEVEIISGREEARLIHLGVESVWPQADRRVLIIDIGGGSAEIIAAEGGRMLEAYSRPLGAVRLREMFLAQDPPARVELDRMREFIEEKLSPAVARLGGRTWNRVIATSATASAATSIVGRVPKSRRDDLDRQRITAPQVRQLYRRISAMDLAARRRVTGMGPRRAEIIVPGVAVLERFLDAFHLPSLYYSRAGVRDGIIADLASRGVGKELSELSREERREIEQLARRYGVPPESGRRTAAIGRLLFHSLQTLHGLSPHYCKLLEAAAYLLDAGHFVSSIGHHKHSWYVVAHSDMPGFTARERLFIAALCRYHRKSMPSPVHNAWQQTTADEKKALLLLIPILRLADNLDRGRDGRVGEIECQVREGGVVLQVHSRAAIDLEQWAAERAGEIFHQIYGMTVSVERAKR
jgi:exopolyphosphatase / guanosine-5'-triphosphate,3'-diphosphate pyrophosphatase